MKIGKAYRLQNKIIVPLTEKNLDSQVLVLVMNYTAESWVSLKTQPIFSAATKYTSINQINNLNKAKTYLLNPNLDGHISFEMMTILYADEQRMTPIYQSADEMPLGVGDSFVEGKNPLEYLVLGFFQRESKIFAAGVGAKTEIRNYPFGANFDAIVNYLNIIAKKKDGLSVIFQDNNTKNTLKINAKSDLEKLFFDNAKLCYWSIDEKRQYNVYFQKQSKPASRPLVAGVKFGGVGGKQKTLSRIDSFTYSSKNIVGFTQASEDGQKVILNIQEQNYEPIIIPDIKGTGNVFLDNFVIINDNIYSPDAEYNYGNYGTEISENLVFGLTTKKELAAKNNNVFRYGAYYDASTALDVSAFSFVGIARSFAVYDYHSYSVFLEEIEKPYLANKTLLSFDYNSALLSKNFSVHPPIYYVGQGRFTCLQSNEGVTESDKYGVGDTFDIDGKNLTIVCMSDCFDKKGNLVKILDCMTTESLMAVVDNIQTAALVRHPLTLPFIEKHSTNHISAFEIRKKIKDAYLMVSTSGVKISPYQEYKDLLGEEYDDDFLGLIAALDWSKISDLQKKDATIIDSIKALIKQSYVDYLIEKVSKGITQKKENTDTKSVKFFFDAEEQIMSFIMQNIEDKFGKDFQESSNLKIGNGEAQNIPISEIGSVVSFLIGNVRDWKKYYTQGFHSQHSIISCQENNEPLLVLPIMAHLDVGDGQSKYYMPSASEYTDSFTNREHNVAADGDYFRLYFGDTIMFYLWAVFAIQQEGATYIPKSKQPKVFPFILNELGINLLKYMNRFGIFTSVEDMVARLEKLSQSSGSAQWVMPKRWFFNLFTSKSSTIQLDYTEKSKIISEGVRQYINSNNNFSFLDEKDKFIEYLNSLPIEWGNVDAPYMQTSVTTVAAAPIKKRRSPKQITSPPIAPKQEFEWLSDWVSYLLPESLEQFKAKYGYENTDLVIKQRRFSANYPTQTSDAAEFILLLFETSSVLNDELEKEVFDPLYAIEEYIDFETMQNNYPLLKEQIADLTNNPSTYIGLFYVDADNFVNAAEIVTKDINVSTTTPPITPTTNQFDWDGVWYNTSVAKDQMEVFNKKYKFSDDTNISYANFNAADGERYTIYTLDKLTAETDTSELEQLIENISLDEDEVETLMNDNPQINTDMLSIIAAPRYAIFSKFVDSPKVSSVLSDLIFAANNPPKPKKQPKQPKQSKQSKEPKQPKQTKEPRKSKKDKQLDDAVAKLKNFKIDEL